MTGAVQVNVAGLDLGAMATRAELLRLVEAADGLGMRFTPLPAGVAGSARCTACGRPTRKCVCDTTDDWESATT